MQVEDIGLAKQHLESGYPKVVRERQELEVELTNFYDEIQNGINEFEQLAIAAIPPRILLKHDSYFPETDDFRTFYYRQNFLSHIFEEIQARINGKATFPAIVFNNGIKVKDKEGFDTTVSKYELSHRGDYLAIGEEAQIRELFRIFSDLHSNTKLEEYVNSYNSVQKKTSENEGSKKYYTSIDNMWDGICHNGEFLRGTCKYCPNKSVFDYF